mgnify:CR=1 FL=1
MVNDRLPPGYPTPADSGPPLTHPSFAADEGAYADPTYGATAGWHLTDTASATDGHGTPQGDTPPGAFYDPGYAGAYGTGQVDPTTGYGTDTTLTGLDGTGTQTATGYDTTGYDTATYGTGTPTGTSYAGYDQGYDTGLYGTGAYGGGLHGTALYDTGTQDTAVWQAATTDEASAFPGSPSSAGYTTPGGTDPSLGTPGQPGLVGTDTGSWTPGWDTADWSADTHTTATWHADALLTGTDPATAPGPVDPLSGQPDPLTDPTLAADLSGTPAGPGYDTTPGTAPSGYPTDPADTTAVGFADAATAPLDQTSAPESGATPSADATEAPTADTHPSAEDEDPPPAVPTDYGVPARARRRAAPRARRSALLTVAVPSAAVMGMAVVAAASVHDTGADGEDGSTQAATDPSSVVPVQVNSKLDTQLDGLSRKADSFADRASRTQERIDLKKRQELERKRREAEAARREALRPKFALPVAQHGLSAYYGQAGANWMSLHTGIDFPVNYGTPVMAATDGTVRTQWDPSYGNMVIVTAPDGTETWYCHLASAKIRSGSVKAGDVIAYSGNSGNSTGPHLHFEVHPGGGPAIDPLAWLRSHGLDPT